MMFKESMRMVVLAVSVMTGGMPALQAAAGDQAHAHPKEGPHHGSLIELGKEAYHAELVHDDTTDTVTVYLLDADAENAVAIPSKPIVLNLRVAGKPRQFTLPATPQEGDAEGTASTFAITSKPLCQALDTHGATGRLNVTIEGKVYVGTVGGHTHPH